MARDLVWTNSDGLAVGFGTHSRDNDVPADTRNGTSITTRVEITLADLVDTFAQVDVKPQSVRIPRGSIITEAYVNTKVAAASSGGGTLDIGLWGVDGSGAVDDADGIVADIAVSEMNAVGEVHICDGALVSSSGNTAAAGIVTVGATANSDCVIAPSYETAVFQSGVVVLTVTYFAPFGSTGGTLAN